MLCAKLYFILIRQAKNSENDKSQNNEMIIETVKPHNKPGNFYIRENNNK